ncbi:MAG: nuclear transport factor 2 family protein [Proteobacteria bacterium]|nr:nuclear transport factor 2 family protein [Pseudomonadota bacterium]
MNNDQAALARLLDEAALRRTAELYAQGADRRDKAVWAAIVTSDCVIEAPGIVLSGRAQIVAALDIMAELYVATQHRVHNQVVSIDGNSASGETYSTAGHLSVAGASRTLLTWAIRYQDRWRREAAGWRFAHRRLILDWTETRTL